jgi:hypothetical protein
VQTTIDTPADQVQTPPCEDRVECHTPLLAEIAAVKELLRDALNHATSRVQALDRLIAAVDEALKAEPNSTIANIVRGPLEDARAESRKVLLLMLEDAKSRMCAVQRNLANSTLTAHVLHIGGEKYLTLADDTHLRVAWARYQSRAATIGIPDNSRMFTWTPIRYLSFRDILARVQAIEPPPARRPRVALTA